MIMRFNPETLKGVIKIAGMQQKALGDVEKMGMRSARDAKPITCPLSPKVNGTKPINRSEERLIMLSGEALFVIQVFALWLTHHGRLRAEDVLLKWGMPINGDCVLCGGYAGIRPKIIGPEEGPTDFVVQGEETHGISSLVNQFGIDSPGLTFSMAITEHIAAKLLK
ncbi:hypothetical protein CQW23_30894 [Capsicum baccatum]|uniref:FAD dependent oxidoreductase domain-containing protein n=1 Tax=Capsicum baccatum TaxID=33114 RepID=A0A2G2V967_CAPBA|nr:hypothetical protein CQW23_30894 [Capsicum baccatum]